MQSPFVCVNPAAPKLAYYKLQQIYNPILISLDYPLIEYKLGTVLRAEI